MGLVHHQQKIFGEIINQGKRRLPGGAPVHMAGIVFNAAAVAHLSHHFQIILGPLGQPLGFQKFALGIKHLQPVFQLGLDAFHGPFQILPAGHIVGGRENGHMGPVADNFSGEHIHFHELVHLIVKHLDADGLFIITGRDDLDHIAPHPEGAPFKINLVAIVLDLHQLFQDGVALHLLPYPERQHHVVIFLRRAQTVNAADAGHDDHVPAFKESAGGAVAQLINLVVDRGILFNIGIRLGNIGFRLVIIVVGNKVFHGIFREECFQLAGQLRRQSLVVGDDQGRLAYLVDDLGHGISLACTGSAQQHLTVHALLQSLYQFGNGLGLVARRLERCL